MHLSKSQTRSNTIAHQQDIPREVKVPCRYHNGSICLNYCHEHSCFRMLCQQCIEQHLEHHKKNGLSVLSIKSLKKVRQFCVDKLNRLLEQLYGKMSTLQKPKNPQQILQQASLKFQAVKKIMFEIIEQQLNRFQDQLRAKVNQSFSTIKNLQDIHENLSKIIMQLNESKGIIVQGTHEMPETVQKILAMDDQIYRQTFNRQANSYTQKLGMIDFDVSINQGLFRNSVNECLKINKNQIKPEYEDMQVSRSRSRSFNKNQFSKFNNSIQQSSISLAPAVDSGVKYLHFFETDQSNLHLYDFSSGYANKLKIQLPPEYIVPSFHASLLSANGYIFISGGKVEIGNKQTKSNLLSKFSLKSRTFKHDFAKVKKRSSHSLCEFGDYIYILGGFGMLTNGQDYDLQYSVQRVCMKSGDITIQEPSKYGGANISVVFNNQIFKASEEGVQLYSLSQRKWTPVSFSMKNYMFTRGCGWTKLSNDSILVYGGYQQNDEFQQPIDTCELWKISISPYSDKSSLSIVKLQDLRLPQKQGFLNSPGICHNGVLYALQNICDETSEDNILEGERKLISFDGSNWRNVKIN